jgi:hypothetical protein
MKIALLSRNRKLYSSRRIIEAAQERGHEIVVVDVLRAYMNIAAHKPSIHYRGELLEGFEAVIPRIGASVTHYGLAVLRQFEMMGVVSLNESVAIGRRSFARQVAIAAAIVAPRYRHAANRLRQQARRHQGRDQDGRRRAAGSQVAAGHPGYRRGAGGNPEGR